MVIPESQYGIIWKAIDHWRVARHLSIHYLSLLFAGTEGPYMSDRIARGIEDGSEEITSDLLHTCVRIFGLVSARQGGSVANLSDEECIELLVAPLVKKLDQGKFEL